MSDTGIVGGYWPHGEVALSPCGVGGELAQQRSDVWSQEGRRESALETGAVQISRWDVTPADAVRWLQRVIDGTITP